MSNKKRKTISIDVDTKSGEIVDCFLSRAGHKASLLVVGLIESFLVNNGICDCNKVESLSPKDISAFCADVKKQTDKNKGYINNNDIEDIRREIAEIKDYIGMNNVGKQPIRPENKGEDNKKTGVVTKPTKNDKISTTDAEDIKNILDNW